jgi:hypothetical protein
VTVVETPARARPRLGDRAVATLTKRAGRPTRRNFLVRTAIFASALVVNPLRYLLRPGTAYASLCGPDASCGSGWTAFCCTVNGGQNTCPPGSTPAGWWKADNSSFCHSGPRYYIDCNASCGSCGCGASGVCAPGCVACNCHCASGTCDERFTCCNEFRYGQCHQDLACVGPIVCRVVTCVAPWEFDATCTTTSATANATALHDAPCLHNFEASVLAFGAAADHGQPKNPLPVPIVGIESSRTGRGYWLVAADGGVFAFGDAPFRGSTGGLRLNHPIVDLARTPTDAGYWLVASDGGVFCFGDARFHGSMGGERLNRPIVGMAATPTGRGYWLVASDGGVFCFGDAPFAGSTGDIRLNRPVVGMAATPTGKGYWFVAGDGGIMAFGDAHFLGSGTSRAHAGSGTDLAARPDGRGYWIATDT